MKLRIIKNRAGTYQVQQQSAAGKWFSLSHPADTVWAGQVFETGDWDRAVDRMTLEATAGRRLRDRKTWNTIQEFDFDKDGIERRKR